MIKTQNTNQRIEPWRVEFSKKGYQAHWEDQCKDKGQDPFGQPSFNHAWAGAMARLISSRSRSTSRMAWLVGPTLD